MTRRVFIGKIGGQWDARISRPGYDAATADVNDRKQISFAASRGTLGQVAEAGSIPTLETWVPFQNSYASIPCAILVLNRGGHQSFGAIDTFSWMQGSVSHSRIGSTYILVVEQTRLKVTRPHAVGFTQPPVAGDTFSYFVVS